MESPRHKALQVLSPITRMKKTRTVVEGPEEHIEDKENSDMTNVNVDSRYSVFSVF